MFTPTKQFFEKHLFQSIFGIIYITSTVISTDRSPGKVFIQFISKILL